MSQHPIASRRRVLRHRRGPRRPAPSSSSAAPATTRDDDRRATTAARQHGRAGAQRRRRATRSSSASPARPPTTAGWPPSTSPRQAEAEKYDDIELQRRRGHQRRQPADQPGRDLHQRQGRRDRAAADRRRRPDRRSPSRRWRPASRSSTSTASSPSPFAARATILGDNYGMGVSAGTYACQLIEDKDLDDPVIAEIAGIDSLPLTQDRIAGLRRRARRRAARRSTTGSPPSSPSSPARRQASNLLQAAPKIDVIWNHDDDQGVGVKAAFDNASRDEFAFIGGAGSCNAMQWIKDGDDGRPPSSTRRPRPPTASGWPG